jgi:hypothetical protein
MTSEEEKIENEDTNNNVNESVELKISQNSLTNNESLDQVQVDNENNEIQNVENEIKLDETSEILNPSSSSSSPPSSSPSSSSPPSSSAAAPPQLLANLTVTTPLTSQNIENLLNTMVDKINSLTVKLEESEEINTLLLKKGKKLTKIVKGLDEVKRQKLDEGLDDGDDSDPQPPAINPFANSSYNPFLKQPVVSTGPVFPSAPLFPSTSSFPSSSQSIFISPTLSTKEEVDPILPALFRPPASSTSRQVEQEQFDQFGFPISATASHNNQQRNTNFQRGGRRRRN